jgi:hypothetical protein
MIQFDGSLLKLLMDQTPPGPLSYDVQSLLWHTGVLLLNSAYQDNTLAQH